MAKSKSNVEQNKTADWDHVAVCREAGALGQIWRALSGFYYVMVDGSLVMCRARGRFRNVGETPLVGDFVRITHTEPGYGMVDEILPRRNVFVRPPVANIDCMILLASAVNPVTDPFLLDRITVISELKGAETVICLNKTDLDPADDLFEIYQKSGIKTIRTSAKTHVGIEALRVQIHGKVCAFVGNSGVGKSSVLNALAPGFTVKTAEVSEKLGRGKHTTRHVELFPIGEETKLADTPGFASFDVLQMDIGDKYELQHGFVEFAPFIDECRYRDCAHIAEQGCAVLAAVADGVIPPSRHESYVRLYKSAQEIKPWDKPRK